MSLFPQLRSGDAPCSMIVACAKNLVIGKNGTMPWHLPEDLAYFKQRTLGKPMLMGSKTFRSLPGVLPGRYHIVVTSAELRPHPRVIPVGSCATAYQLAQQLCSRQQQPQAEIMVIGGAQLYATWLPLAQRIYMTQIDKAFDGDVFFPQLDEWQWICETQPWQLSTNGLRHRFTTWHRQAG